MRQHQPRSLVVVTARSLLAIALTCACEQPVLCIAGDTPAVLATEHPIAHAHNDYEHERPLADALDAGFQSIEADLWFRDGAIQISHDAFGTKGTLDAFYLAPLDALITAQGRVLDEEEGALTLWLDLKDGGPELREALGAALDARPWLTRFDDDGIATEGAVTAILTGDAASKRALVEDTPAPRPFARDSNDLSRDDVRDPRVVAAALSFGAYVGAWDGVSPASSDLARRCGCAVELAHTLGRRVRMYGAPDTPDSWSLQIEHGVDFVNADDLVGLSAMLAEAQ